MPDSDEPSASEKESIDERASTVAFEERFLRSGLRNLLRTLPTRERALVVEEDPETTLLLPSPPPPIEDKNDDDSIDIGADVVLRGGGLGGPITTRSLTSIMAISTPPRPAAFALVFPAVVVAAVVGDGVATRTVDGVDEGDDEM